MTILRVLIAIAVFVPMSLLAQDGDSSYVPVKYEYNQINRDSIYQRDTIRIYSSAFHDAVVKSRLALFADTGVVYTGWQSDTVEVGDTVCSQSVMPWIEDGYWSLGYVEYAIDTLLAVPNDSISHCIPVVNYPLYGYVADSALQSLSMDIDTSWSPDTSGLANLRRDGKGKKSLASSVIVNVNLTGHVRVVFPVSRTLSVERGVPAVEVHFYWQQADNSASEAVYLDGPSYAVTADPDGAFTFERQIDLSGQEELETAQRIYCVVRAANPATRRAGDLNAKRFFPPTPTSFYDVSSLDFVSTHTLSASLRDPNDRVLVDSREGNALSQIWRARECAVNDLGIPSVNLEVVFYDFDINRKLSAYVRHYLKPGSAFLDPTYHTIVYNQLPPASLSFHEYGHFVQDQVSGIPDYDLVEQHRMGMTTNSGAAFVEGWAEFFASAAYSYWYRRENPETRDIDQGAPWVPYSPYCYQFLDGIRSVITTPFYLNDGDEEGSVARIIYNLYDDKSLREPRPNYSGDNEDLDVNYPFGHPRPWICYSLVGVGDGDGPWIQQFTDNYLRWIPDWYTVTRPYHDVSIWAMYDQLTSQGDHIRSATPTILNLSGNRFSRNLSWNQHDEPGVGITEFDYPVESDPNGHSHIAIYKNDEGGFGVYRSRKLRPGEVLYVGNKEPVVVLDDKLNNAFSLIGTAGSNVESYTDNATLADGEYEYVVVAFRELFADNPTFFSIPKAKARIRLKNIGIRDGKDERRLFGCTHLPVLDTRDTIALIPFSDSNLSGGVWMVDPSSHSGMALQIAGDTLLIIRDSTLNPFTYTINTKFRKGVDTSDVFVVTALGANLMSRPLLSVYQGGQMIPDTSLVRDPHYYSDIQADLINYSPLKTNPTIAGDSTVTLRIVGPQIGSLNCNFFDLIKVCTPDTAQSYADEIISPCSMTSDTVYQAHHQYDDVKLVSAVHSRFGTVTASLLKHDSLWVNVRSTDTLTLTFKEKLFVAADSVHYLEYAFGMRAIYDTVAGSVTTIGPDVSSVNESENASEFSTYYTDDLVYINGQDLVSVKAYAADGKLAGFVTTLPSSALSINADHWPSGFYILDIRTLTGRFQKTLRIVR